MVTKVTRDVWDGRVRPIVDGIDIDGDCSANFTMDGVTIGGSVPCDGTFVNLTATNLVVTGTIDGSGATVVGTWQATYSDIAEMYRSDKDYPPGTVVKLGGEQEITATEKSVDSDVFGVVSTQPAYVLNSSDYILHSDAKGAYLPVVLVGRVPTRVVGPVTKGCRLVSSNVPGVARAILDSEKGCHTVVFGRSLVDDNGSAERLVEIAFVTVK